ncbi:MAG: DUF2497 domain-containing protein [Kiloniellales bacterium]
MSSETGGAEKPGGQMQEVLSSIKQIIDEDKAGHSKAAIDLSPEDEDVLELTELEEDEGEEIGPVVSVFEKRPAAPTRPAERPAGDAQGKPAAVAQLKGLREAAKIAKDISGDQSGSGGALERYASKAVEPMVEAWVQKNMPRLAETRADAAVQTALKDWMDRHLEAIVERIVREEVARMVAEASQD